MRKIFDCRADIEKSATEQAIKLDKAIIRKIFPDCKKIIVTGIEVDDLGIDYTAVLENGRQVRVDIKKRSKGCSKFWRQGPELQIEIWSNVEYRHVGWSVDDTKKTDLIIYVFDRFDYDRFYVFDARLLRKTIMIYGREWYKKYKSAYQYNKADGKSWRSQCMFVPAGVVVSAMQELKQMHGLAA